jgi:predicted DNA-binding transcriptional regulator YafY
MSRTNRKKRKEDTQPQLTRLHEIVKRIQRGDYPSAKMMAREFEKHRCTIMRDLDFIRDVWKMPLAYDPYRYGFYFTEQVGKFPMVQISERELISVFLAQKALAQYRGTPFEGPLQSAFSKLTSSMKGELSVSWADLDAAISFRGMEANPVDMEVLQKLAQAVRTRNEVEFKYYKLFRPEEGRGKAKNEGETRRVRPYHLANIGNQWYLFAYDYLRKDMRRFVPSRMAKVKVRPERFERPKDFSIDQFLKGSFSVFSGGKPTAIRIWFGQGRAQVIRERKWHQSQTIKELGNGEIELRLELSGFEEITPWILSWGRHARVVAPAALAKAVREEAEEVRRGYGEVNF